MHSVNVSLVKLIVQFVFDKWQLYMVIKGGRQWLCEDGAKMVSTWPAKTRMATFINVRHIHCVIWGGTVIGLWWWWTRWRGTTAMQPAWYNKQSWNSVLFVKCSVWCMYIVENSQVKVNVLLIMKNFVLFWNIPVISIQNLILILASLVVNYIKNVLHVDLQFSLCE